MSLNEDYLDDLLKAVITEDEKSFDAPEEDREKAIDELGSTMAAQVNEEDTSETNHTVTDESIMEEEFEKEETMEEETETKELTTDVSDVEELLKSIDSEESSMEESGIESDDRDILSMLDSMEEDSDLAEIGELLNKDENHEAISDDESDVKESSDVADILNAMEEKTEDNDIDAANEDEKPQKEKKKLFGKKNKKVNDAVENEGEEKGEKKKGFFAQILDLFFEEEDLDTEESGVGEEGATEENQAILEELDAGKKAKPKKEKKKKEKKEKKPKPEKPKKTPKPEKEKKPKKAAKPGPNEKPEKKIPKKKIIMVAIFAVSVFIAIYLLTSLVPGTMNIQSAKDAYAEGDYRGAYTTLAGMNLNETNSELFKRAAVILELKGKYDGYLNYQKMNMGMEALNALLKGIEKYDKLYVYGEQYGVTGELDKTYQQILGALSDNYGLSEEDARKILEYDRITYTKRLDSIINGTEFVDPDAPIEEEESLSDMLPEEEALLNMTVIGGEDADRKAASEESTEDMLPEEASMTEDGSGESEPTTEDQGSRELYSGEVGGDELSADFSQE